MPRTLLRNDQWERIKDLLPGKASDRGVTAKDNRLFVEAVLWIARTGSPWRDLDPALGNWHATYTRFSRWSKTGVWARVIEAVSDDADLEVLFIDSTAVRAHQHAAGAQKKKAAKRSGARAAG
jgi:putative transposase